MSLSGRGASACEVQYYSTYGSTSIRIHAYDLRSSDRKATVAAERLHVETRVDEWVACVTGQGRATVRSDRSLLTCMRPGHERDGALLTHACRAVNSGALLTGPTVCMPCRQLWRAPDRPREDRIVAARGQERAKTSGSPCHRAKGLLPGGTHKPNRANDIEHKALCLMSRHKIRA